MPKQNLVLTPYCQPRRTANPRPSGRSGFVLTRVAAGNLLCTSRAYAPLPCCLAFRTGDVEPPLEFLADLMCPIHSDPNNWIINHLFIEPSANSDFIDPIQLPNFVFDLCDIHIDHLRNL